MGPINGMNPNKVSYFSMEEYVDRIKLENSLLEHLDETSKEFDRYLKQLASYGNYPMVQYWIDSLRKELNYSQEIENQQIFFLDEIEKKGVFFDTLQISHNRIKQLHQFVTKSEVPTDYRKGEVRVSRIKDNLEEDIFWYGVQPEDLKKFLDDFIKIYKSSSISLINSNPFLKSALIHLLFIRIHPFGDWNGRTGRMIHNIKFTESINKIYGMNLKICPLNLSHSILINKPTYARKIDDIYFDLEHDSNEEINKWFNFILNMIDEQIYYHSNRINTLDRTLKNLKRWENTDNSDIHKKIKQMKVDKVTN